MTDDHDTYTVVREIEIPAPVGKVHSALVDFHEWQHWSPWEGLDPLLQRTYSGAPSGVGTTYAWKGNRKVGEGRMEITGDQPDEVVIALDFVKPFKSSNTTTFSLRPEGEGTHVIWTMVGPKTLGTRIMGIFKSMDELIGKDFEKGLSQLRSYVAG
jgi:uncharacterized protein YndB with AHSA1/START domain